MYRYPFTPYPYGWYRIGPIKKQYQLFGRIWELESTDNDNFRIIDIAKPKEYLPIHAINGEHFVFFDKAQKRAPFKLPYIPEFSDNDWHKPFTLNWRIRTHLQEIAENALDFGHFTTVHTYRYYPQLLDFKIDGHQFFVSMQSKRRVFYYLDESRMDITYHGMGVVVSDFRSSSGITLKVLLMSTPIDAEHVDIVMKVAIKKSNNILTRLAAKFIIPKQIRSEFTNDQPVWESKIYRNRPVLCEAEKNIMRIRQWAAQFYD